MPVPAPATALIVEGVPVRTGLVNHEATTPTGAAILVAMADEFSEQLQFPIRKTGYGIGNRDSEVPNVLRVYLCESDDKASDLLSEEALLLESNIDDMNPEHFEFILEKLFKAGASDAWLVPIVMKKSRPAATLTILCSLDLADKMKEIVFTHSSSIGIRENKVRKSMLRRKEGTIETKYGSVRIKQSFFAGELVRIKPEFEDCKLLAEKNSVSIAEIEKAVIKKL